MILRIGDNELVVKIKSDIRINRVKHRIYSLKGGKMIGSNECRTLKV